MSIVAKES